MTSSTQRGTTAAAAARRKKRKPASVPTPNAPTALSEVEQFITSWTPSNRPGVKDWDEIAYTVRSLTQASNPGGSEMAHKHLRALAKHVARRHEAGMAIDDWTELLSDNALAATLGASAPTKELSSTKRTELTYLRRMRERALPEVYGKPHELVLERKSIAQPYTAAEIASLLAWARNASSQVTPRVHAAVLLGLASGMDGRELPGLRGTDVQCTPWGLVVCAPGTGKSNGTRLARIVPVLAEYEVELARVASRAAKASFGGPSMDNGRDMGALSEAVKKTAGLPALSGARLRATWTRTLLERRASYVAMRQAGVSADPNRVMGQLSADIVMPAAEYVSALRFGTIAFKPEAFAHLAQWCQA